MYIVYHIKYLLHKRHASDTGGLSIRMRITVRGCRPLDFPTGITVALSAWDADRQHVRRTCHGAARINRSLDEWRAAVDDLLARYELIEKHAPTPSQLKAAVNAVLGRDERRAAEAESHFFTIFDTFTQHAGVQNQWSRSTYSKFATLRKHLYEFDRLITFEDCTENKMQQYMQHLYNANFSNTTIAKHLGLIRWFLHWAADHGYYLGNVHTNFHPKLKGTEVGTNEIIYLTKEELLTLRNRTFPDNKKYLERVRDVFMFCCFSGLRYSDVRKLRLTDIKDTYISVVTQKTTDGLKIELNKYTRAILQKYTADGRPSSSLALPVVSNQKMNEYLKELCRTSGIDTPVRRVTFTGSVRKEVVYPKWQLITTHAARRTFVVTALQLGIASEVIMKWTGHADFESMKPYVAIVDELKKREMSRFNEL